MAEVALRPGPQELRIRRRALHGLDLAIGSGEFVSLLGPSGCGKTTTLRMLAGLELPDLGRDPRSAGRLVNDVAPGARDIAMVFQSYALYPHMTVAAEHRLPAEEARRAQGRARGRWWRGPPRCSSSSPCLDRKPAPALGRPAAAGGARPGAGARPRRCSCSTSRSPTSTPSSAATCGPSWWSCTAASGGPWSTSPTTSSRR